MEIEIADHGSHAGTYYARVDGVWHVLYGSWRKITSWGVVLKIMQSVPANELHVGIRGYIAHWLIVLAYRVSLIDA